MTRFIPIFILIAFATGTAQNDDHRTRADHRDLQIAKSFMTTLKEKWLKIVHSVWPGAFMKKRHRADFDAKFEDFFGYY